LFVFVYKGWLIWLTEAMDTMKENEEATIRYGR